MPTPRKYNTIAERQAAQRKRDYIRDYPRKLANARSRHRNVVKEIKRAGLEHLLEAEEKDWE